MPSRKRGSNIKKDRIMMILKSRKLTITKLAAETGYDRRSLNYAIIREYMDNQTLDDIARYLDVSPDFIAGKTKLLKLKSDKKAEYLEHFSSDLLDPSGYLVPSYSEYLVAKSIEEQNNTLLTSQIPAYGYLKQAFSELGKTGIYDGTALQRFDSDFIKSHFNYLIVETYSFMRAQAVSAWNKDKKYINYLANEEAENEYAMQQIDLFDSFFDVIEDASAPDPGEDQHENG